jgi:hypothetical protein
VPLRQGDTATVRYSLKYFSAATTLVQQNAIRTKGQNEKGQQNEKNKFFVLSPLNIAPSFCRYGAFFRCATTERYFTKSLQDVLSPRHDLFSGCDSDATSNKIVAMEKRYYCEIIAFLSRRYYRF